MDLRILFYVLVSMVIHKGYSDDQPNSCSDNEFQCADGKKCIYKSWLCDGERDCDDFSDEKYCHPKSDSSTILVPTGSPTSSTTGRKNYTEEYMSHTTVATPGPTTKLTSTVPTHDPACERLVLSGSCRNVRYRFTRLPNFFSHSNQNQVRRALRQWRPILQLGCSSSLEDFVCRLYAPPCKATKLPCRSLCRRVKKECQKTMKRNKLKWPSSLRCNNLPKKRCLANVHSTSTTRKPTTKHYTMTAIKPQPVSQSQHWNKCQKLKMLLCQDLKYNFTSFPNSLNHNTQEEAGLELHQFFPLLKVGCSPQLKMFLCSVYAPMCIPSYGTFPPCRDLCRKARDGCVNLMRQYGFYWPDAFNCSRFPNVDDGVCIGVNRNEVMTTSRPMYTREATTTLKTPPLPRESPDHNCGGVLTNTNGVVTSPNYPNTYPLKTRCKWTIKLPNLFNLVKITINVLRLEEDRNCFYDYVLIVDKMLNQVGARHCGTYRLPYAIPVRGNEVTIIFVSDGNTNKKGFSLSYIGLMT